MDKPGYMRLHRRRLAMFVVGFVLIWGVILPWLSHLDSPSRRIAWFREHRVNATARFYTELIDWPGE
jgi:hypothetical protein